MSVAAQNDGSRGVGLLTMPAPVGSAAIRAMDMSVFPSPISRRKSVQLLQRMHALGKTRRAPGRSAPIDFRDVRERWRLVQILARDAAAIAMSDLDEELDVVALVLRKLRAALISTTTRSWRTALSGRASTAPGVDEAAAAF